MTRTIKQQVHDAIRPQLAELWKIEKHHQRMARLERLRQRYDMFDETERQVELHATKQSFKYMGEAVGTAFKHIHEAAQLAVQGFTVAFNTGESVIDQITASPVPAEDHAGVEHEKH